MQLVLDYVKGLVHDGQRTNFIDTGVLLSIRPSSLCPMFSLSILPASIMMTLQLVSSFFGQVKNLRVICDVNGGLRKQMLT